MSLSQSVPTPRHEMRRRMALRVLNSLEPGRFLEAGCGRGELLPAMNSLGYVGVAVEPAEDARAIAMVRTNSFKGSIQVVSNLEEVNSSGFDYLLAFEVLEHIRDDFGELARWVSLLRPGGTSLISVPAHMRFWSHADTAVGHFRRYERADVENLHLAASLSIVHLWSYGFPVTSITRRLRRLADTLPSKPDSMQERTAASSHVSHRYMGMATPLLRRTMTGFGRIADVAQRPFVSSNLGDGYFVIAVKA